MHGSARWTSATRSSDRAVNTGHGARRSRQRRLCEAFGLNASALAQRGLRVVATTPVATGGPAFRRTRATTRARPRQELGLLLDVLGLARVSLVCTSMGAASALLFARAHPERVERLVLRSPAPFGVDMMRPRRMLHGLALSYQVLGTSLTARLASLRPGPGGAVRMRALLQGQRRASIVPALRGFPPRLDTRGLDTIESPTLILTNEGTCTSPLGRGPYDVLPNATLSVAPTATFWDRRTTRRI